MFRRSVVKYLEGKISTEEYVFMWLALKNKVLNWELLQKSQKQGQGIFSLCFQAEETIIHIFAQYQYIMQI